VKRLISTTSFVLKGGGWYSDLYSRGKSKADAGDAGESKPASGGDAAAAKEATPKPASGGDAKPAPDKGGKRKAAKTEAA
jgi:hypothetical protein